MRSVPSSTHFDDLVGASPVFLDVCRQLRRGADSLARSYLQRILKNAPAGSSVRAEARKMLDEIGE